MKAKYLPIAGRTKTISLAEARVMFPEAKYTPGPWLYRGKSCAVYTAPPAGAKYSFGDHIFTFHEDEEPNDDDLALILAAPDLLAALQNLCGDWTEGEGMALGDRVKQARAAIAKATGEAL